MYPETRTDYSSTAFVDYLRQEFSRRIQKNSRYSLRSFSRDLDVSLTTLSSVLSEQRPVSQKLIRKVGEKLCFSPVQLQYFLVHNVGSEAQLKNEFSDLIIHEDQFKILMDWRHFAILRLVQTKDFKPDPQWIADRLNSNIFHIKESIDRLVRVGLLKIERKKWTDVSDGKTSYLKTTHTNVNIKKFLKNMLEKSIESLEKDEIEERNHTGMMLSISKKSLPLAIDLIKNFRRSLADILEDKKIEKDEVYYLDIGLFPLSKSINKKGVSNDKIHSKH